MTADWERVLRVNVTGPFHLPPVACARDDCDRVAAPS
jgi:hypothetical protein